MSINSELYNSITNAWQYMLGNNFHWGYFHNENEDLDKATDNLIDLMSSFVKIDKNKHLVDIGCGIGQPATYLHNKYACKVSGLSNSEAGINLANNNAKKNKIDHNLQFFLRDALDTGFGNNTFDIAWIMEMSHLIDNKQKLINEAYRLLKVGGEIVLCDLMFKSSLKPIEVLKNKDKLDVLKDTFGDASMETFDYYKVIFKNAGFSNIVFQDISQEVIPTLKKWEANTIKNKDIILSSISQDLYDKYLKSYHYLTDFYNNNVWGYGVISGIK